MNTLRYEVIDAVNRGRQSHDRLSFSTSWFSLLAMVIGSRLGDATNWAIRTIVVILVARLMGVDV